MEEQKVKPKQREEIIDEMKNSMLKSIQWDIEYYSQKLEESKLKLEILTQIK